MKFICFTYDFDAFHNSESEFQFFIFQGADVLLFGALSPEVQGGDLIDEHHHIHQVRPG